MTSSISNDDFRRNGELLEDISLAVSDCYDYFIYTESIVISFDNFLRSVKVGEVYSFGNVFEYYKGLRIYGLKELAGGFFHEAVPALSQISFPLQ